jgi:hypothetical protein
MVTKEEVFNWFRSLNGAHRIETLCALMNCCVPFEIRYVGSIIEELGRRDFHELRDVEHKANTFAHHLRTLEENKAALFNTLKAEPGQPGPVYATSSTQHAPANNLANSVSHPSILLSGGKDL